MIIPGTQQIFGPNGVQNQAFGSSNAHDQNKFGSSDSGSQTNSETFNENGWQGEKSSASSFSNNVNNGGGNGNFGTDSNSNSGVANDLAFGNSGANAGGAFFGGFPPGNGGRFKRAAKDALVFPKEEEEAIKKDGKVVIPKPAESPKPDVAKVNGTATPNGVESRFGFFGGGGEVGPIRGLVREVIGGLIRGNDERQYYGAYNNGPGYGQRPPYQRPPYEQPPYNPYPEHHHHGRPEYYPSGNLIFLWKRLKFILIEYLNFKN